MSTIRNSQTKISKMEKVRFHLFLTVFISLLTSCGEHPNFEASKSIIKSELPNIILLIGDDQGYPYFGFMGADYVNTPNMDSLANSGVLFTQGYVPENHCRPSLQTLMTGTLPIDYSIKKESIMVTEMQKDAYKNLSKSERDKWKKNFDFHAMKYFETLPRILEKKGYQSFQGGKWWEFNYQNGGFTEGMTKGWKAGDREKKGWFYQFMGGDGRKLARATMQPVYDFIEKNMENPFFIWYAPELPHYPFDAPDQYYDLYADKDMSESAKRYYANCTWFDDGVGELKRFLKKKGVFENTFFIYVNDNGWEQNPKQEFRQDSLRWHNGGDKGKLSIYDQSFRTPIIFSWKGKITKGKRYDYLINSADIPATILDYLGIDLPDDYHGRSYRQAINGNLFKPRKEIIGKVNQIRSEEDMMGKKVEAYWIRNEDWFFSWNLTLDKVSLFDMNADPLNNLNLSKNNVEIVDEFKNRILDWKKMKTTTN